MPHHSLGGHDQPVTDLPLREFHPDEHPRLVMGIVIVEHRHQRHTAALFIHHAADVVDSGNRLPHLHSRHDHPHVLVRDHIDGGPLPLMNLGPHPEGGRVGHHEQPLPRGHALAPGYEHLLHDARERGPQIERRERVSGVFRGRRFGARLPLRAAAADQRPEMLAGDLQLPLRLLELRLRPFLGPPGVESGLLADRPKPGQGRLQIGLPFLHDPAGEQAPFDKRLGAGVDLFGMEQRGIGAEDPFAVVPQGAVREPILHLGQRRMRLERGKQRCDIRGEHCLPLGCIGGDLLVGLTLADLIAGHSHLPAGEFGQDVPSRYGLPHNHLHRRHDAFHGGEIVDLLAGVVVEPSGHCQLVLKRSVRDRCQADRDSVGHRDELRASGRRRRFGGGLFVGVSREVMGGQPPPGQREAGQHGDQRQAADGGLESVGSRRMGRGRRRWGRMLGHGRA